LVFYGPLSCVLGLCTSHLSFGLVHPRFTFHFTHPHLFSFHLPPAFLFRITTYLLLGYTHVILYLNVRTPITLIYVLLFLSSSHTSVYWFGSMYSHLCFPFAYPLPLSSFAHQLLFYPSWRTPWGAWHGFTCPLSFSLADGFTNLYLAYMSACWST
jgi:hypothetical protein